MLKSHFSILLVGILPIFTLEEYAVHILWFTIASSVAAYALKGLYFAVLEPLTQLALILESCRGRGFLVYWLFYGYLFRASNGKYTRYLSEESH
jgi:hypothetical protein